MGWAKIEREVIKLTNAERTKRGLKPLKSNRKLHEAAEMHSEYMLENRYLGHYGPSGSEPWDRTELVGYSSRGVGENVFHYPYKHKRPDRRTARLLVKGWMESSGHRKNILSREFKDIGVAVVRRLPKGRTYYVTQVFGMGKSGWW